MALRVYTLACADNSYYTGVGEDLDHRLWQHETGFFPDCYTYTHRPLQLVWSKYFENHSEAMNFERQVKGWSRKKKEALIMNEINELKKTFKP